MKNILYSLILCFVQFCSSYALEVGVDEASKTEVFEQICDDDWTLVFHDTCTGDWEDGWFLDGERATVKNSDRGMHFEAGPVKNDHSCHAVLWTQESFKGDIKIEYEYTRMDSEREGGSEYFIHPRYGDR